MRRAATARRLVCVLVALGAGACASSTKRADPPNLSSPSSTAAPTTPSVRAYLSGPGAAIVTVERASQVLARGTRPTRATCVAFVARASRVTAGPGWARAIRDLPDPALRASLVTDLNDKFFLARACVSTSGLNDSADEQRVYRLYRDRSEAVAARLAALGVRLS